MADPLPNEDPEITFDAAALEKMSFPQIADMLNSMIAAFEVRMAKLEKPAVGAEPAQIDIDTDENIGNEQIGNKFNLWLEADKARENIGMVAGAGGDGGSYTFEAQTGMGCLELNQCNYPFAILTTFILAGGVTTIAAVRIEVANCPYTPCIPVIPTPSESSAAVAVDIWRICSSADESETAVAGDLLLSPYVLELGLSTFDVPVVQLTADGPCYRFIASTMGDITDTDLSIMEGCDNEACDNCYCETLCLRVTDTVTGDWVEFSIVNEGETFCNATTLHLERGGPNGGLADATPTWVDNAWVINVIGPGSAWSANYQGPSTGCPTGTVTKIFEGVTIAPATLSITACASTCTDTGPSEVFIEDFGPGYFGADMSCYIINTDTCESMHDIADTGQLIWDGRFTNKVGDCEWHIDNSTTLYYKNAGGNLTQVVSGSVKLDSSVTPARWLMTILMSDGGVLGDLRWELGGGDDPAGAYEYGGNVDPNEDFTNPACFVLRDTITIASTP